MSLKRRIFNAWNDSRTIFCPVCRFAFPGRLVIDDNGKWINHRALEALASKRGRWLLEVGYQDATCPACSTPMVSHVELTGSFFDKSGDQIVPIVSMYRVLVDENDPEQEKTEQDLELIDSWRLAGKKTDVRRQKTDVRRQKTEDRGQRKEEGRGIRAKG